MGGDAGQEHLPFDNCSWLAQSGLRMDSNQVAQCIHRKKKESNMAIKTSRLREGWKWIVAAGSVVAVCTIISVIADAFNLRDRFTPPPPSTPSCREELKNATDFAVDFTTLHDGDHVPWNISVRGTYKNIPESCKLWIIVLSRGSNLFYPWDPLTIEVGGTWKISTYIGLRPPENKDENFEIGLYLANSEADAKLRSYFSVRCSGDGENRTCDGLRSIELPPSDDLIPIKSIDVKRD
jgi:hypothetical protein